MAHPGGRPTDLTEELKTKARSYLATCVDDFSDPNIKQVELPSVAGLACYLHCARGTVYVWAGKDPEFKDILEEILGAQERKLLNNGLASNYNSNITKLALTKHGYSDTNNLLNNGKNFPTPILQALVATKTESSDNETKADN